MVEYRRIRHFGKKPAWNPSPAKPPSGVRANLPSIDHRGDLLGSARRDRDSRVLG